MSIIDSYLTDYLNEVQPLCEGELGEVQKEAYEKNVPIIPNDVVKLIGVILTMQKPKKILEIGAAVGFSSSFMSKFVEEGGSVTTIDRFDVMIKLARENYKRLKVEDKVNLIEGDAKDILPKLEGQYDIIFMDAAKGQYINILPDCYRLLKVGGMIIADDILQDGTVAKNIEAIERRQRTIHYRLRDFIWEITHNPSLKTSILTIGDGVALCYKTAEIDREYEIQRMKGTEENEKN